jgi:hypothetical protein
MMSLIKWEDGQGKLFTEHIAWISRIESNGLLNL